MFAVNPYRKRSKRCYELAFRYVMDYDDSWTIVHGVIDGEIGHAWLERDAFVFDLTRHDAPVALVDYYHTYRPDRMRRYNLHEACEALARHEERTGKAIYGPWD